MLVKGIVLVRPLISTSLLRANIRSLKITSSRNCTIPAMPCRRVADLSDTQIAEWMDSFDTVMTDCDGVLWIGGEAIPGSPQVINRFRDLGKKIFYVTNNSTKHRKEYLQKFHSLGFGGTMEEVIGTAYLAACYLEDSGFDKSKKVYVVGSTGITQELDDVGIQYLPIGVENGLFLDENFVIRGTTDFLDSDSVGAVLLGFSRNFTFYSIVAASHFLERSSCLFIADCPDVTFVMRDEMGRRLTAPCTGSMVAAVETAAGRKPLVLGKPSPYMFDIVRRRHPSVEPSRTLMIGDRADTDILLGKNCGLQTLLVGSGVHNMNKVREWEASSLEEERLLVPDIYADKLGDLLTRMEAMQKKDAFHSAS